MSTAPEDETSAEKPEAAAEPSAGESLEDLEIAVEDEDSPADSDEASVLEALEQRVATLEGEKKDTYDRLLRSTADLDNLRKRSRREIEDARVDARAKVLRDVLPVFDNLERALAHAGPSDDAATKGIVDGVKLVTRQFEQALAKSNVQPIEAEGQAFDPNVHEAMTQVETADVAPGCVVQVLQTGYTIGERLLRPALVAVAKAPPVEEPAAGANGKSAQADAGAEEEEEATEADSTEPAAEAATEEASDASEAEAEAGADAADEEATEEEAADEQEAASDEAEDSGSDADSDTNKDDD